MHLNPDAVQTNNTPIDSLGIEDVNSNENELAQVPIVKVHPWGSSSECKLGDYHSTGIHPEAESTMMDLDLGHRITQGFNPSAKASNYHGQDSISEGSPVTSAIDISVRCLSDAEIRLLLDTLAGHDILSILATW